jgi:Holliday junction resolvase RusA-like endonuclease|tara:strand:- start:9538 stop:9729 length:192 start_codon:yes stop_codon:yes gene_type:complete
MPKTARRTDLGNVLSVHQKYFEDALVELGCIPDDDYKHIVRTTFVFGKKDKDNPRVIIKVKEL